MKNLFLFYLRIIAKIQLAKIRPVVIGIGGAAGKTSLTNFISLILKTKYKVLESKGKNSETGIPLAILKIDPGNYSYLDWLRIAFIAPLKVIFDWERSDFFVAEMGIDGPFEPRNMQYLLKIIKPKIGVLTNIALEHSEYFDPLIDNKGKDKKNKILELTAREEGLLLKFVPKEGLAIINLDDPLIQKINVKAQKLKISAKNNSADFLIREIETTVQGFKVRFIYSGDVYSIKVNSLLPSYYAYTLLMAIAVSTRFGFSVSSSIEILRENFSLPPGRFSIFRGIKNTLIFDSSYNSSPVATVEALELLGKIAGRRRRVAILGDMRELGSISSQEHRALGSAILKNTDFAILVGSQVTDFTAPVLSSAKYRYLAFSDFTSAKKAILNNIREKDIILVKGSQNTLYLERAVELLLKNPKDKERLPRRGKFWDKKRSETR